MNIIRRFVGWVALNPIRFTVWFALSCASGAILAYYDSPWWLVVGFFAVLGLSCYLDIKAIPVVLLCAALSTQPVRAQEKGMYGVAVVVVVVGGVATYCLVRTCQKLFPKTPKGGTNEPPYVIPGGTPDCAGSWTYAGWVSCYIPQDTNRLFAAASPEMVTLELMARVEASGEMRLSAGRQLSGEEMLDGTDFQKNLAEHGITFGQIGQMSYGLWGRPAYPEEVPISFHEDYEGNKVATVATSGPMITASLERSADLRHWDRVTTASFAVGQPIRIVDSTTSGQMFYRLQAQ